MTFGSLRKPRAVAGCRPEFDMDWCRSELADTDPTSRTEVRAALWPATYDWMRKSVPAYRGFDTDSNIGGLPTMDSRDLTEHGDDYLVPGIDSEVVLMSGGTTSGRVKLIHRALFEFELLQEFELMTLGDEISDGVLLQLCDIGHGLRVPQRTWRGREVLQIPLTSPAHMWLLAELISDPDAGVTAMNGFVHDLALFTEWAIGHGIDLRSTGMREFYFGGVVFGNRSRAAFEAAWGASIRDMFGLTEFHQGHAVICADCGSFHFGHGVLCELLSLDAGAPAKAGDYAEVTLSHLLPLVQRQPLLRYRTGDLVRVGPFCETAGENGVRPLGRVRDCPEIMSGRRWPDFAVAAVLDAFPQLFRKTVRLISLGVSSDEIANPHHQVSFADGRATVEVQLRRDLGPGAERRLAVSIAEAVHEACAADWGCSAAEVPEVAVRLRPVGSLTANLPE